MGEIRATVKEMMEFSYRDVRGGPLTPFPGTPIRRRLRKEGLIKRGMLKDWDSYSIFYDGNVCKFRDKRVEEWQRNFNLTWMTLNAFLDKKRCYMSPSVTCPIVYGVTTFTENEARKMLKIEDNRWQDAVAAHEFFMFLKDHKEATKTTLDYLIKRVDRIGAIERSRK